MKELFFGIINNDVRKLEYQIVEQNHIPHAFNLDTQMAGKKWFYAVLTHYTDLKLCEPETMSMARAKGSLKNPVRFCLHVKKVIDENKIDVTRLFNVC